MSAAAFLRSIVTFSRVFAMVTISPALPSQ
jgi:hypothetical protein